GAMPHDNDAGPVLTFFDSNGDPSDRHMLRDWVDWTRPGPVLSTCSPRASSGAVATLFVTHGTTGQPKFPVSYQRALLERWGRLAGRLEFGPEDVHLAHLPLSHGFGLMMAVTALLTGGRLVFPSSFSTGDALNLIAGERITVISGSPTLFRLMVDRRNQLDLRSVRIPIGTAAPFSLSLLRQVLDDLGLRFMLMYGASEGVGAVPPARADILRGSVGRPQPGSVAIVGPDRNPVPAETVGEIAFSRSMFPVSYWNRGSAASPEHEQSWYYSGDLGRV